MSDAYSFDDDFTGPRTPLKAFRQSYLNELERNPAVHRKLLALTQAEVGNQGPEAQQAFIESVFNRAASRRQTLDQAMQTVERGGYYPGLGDINKVSPTTAANYDDLIKQTGAGSNVGNYATGNASGTVGFNKGPQVAAYGGERFGIEGPDVATMRGIAGGDVEPTAFTVPDQPTGRRQMAEPRGILDLMGMTGSQPGQQPAGLLGMLGDPETMSYLAMMLKGANPHSQLDPAAMLTNAQALSMRKAALAQQQAEQARDNARADRALGLREKEYGDARTERMDERQQRRDLAASQQKRDAEAFADLTGRPPDGAATVPDPTATTELSNDDKIARIDRRLAQGGLSDAGEKQLLRLREQYSKPPSATTLGMMKKDEDALPVYQDVGRKLDRALELAPKVSTGLRASTETTLGPYLGGAAPQQTQDTIEFRNLTQQFALENFAATTKGAVSDKEMFKNLSIAADERQPIEIRVRALKDAKARNDALEAVSTGRLKQLQEGTYGRSPKKSEGKSEGGGGKTRLRFNPETGDFE